MTRGATVALLVLLTGAGCSRGARSTGDAATHREQPASDATSATALMNSRCVVCHSVDYLSQQRLTEPQWRKTVDKMRKFGAPLSDDEAALVAATAARSWPADQPPAEFPRMPPPPGALPGR